MKISGSTRLSAPVGQVWAALRDREVLAATIPGCERLDQIGPGVCGFTVSTSLAAARGSYTGQVALAARQPKQAAHALVLHVDAAGERGTVSADARIELTANPGGGTRLGYDLDAVTGGPIAAVGQRMLAAMAERIAGDFAAGLDQRLAAAAADRAEAAASRARHPSASGSRDGRNGRDGRADGAAVPAQGGPAAANGSSAPAVPGQAGPVPDAAAQNGPEPAAGMPEPAAGVPEAAAGMPEPAAGLPEAAAGVPEPAAGVPEPAVDVPAIPAQRGWPASRSVRRPTAGDFRRLLPAREAMAPAGLAAAAAGFAAGLALGILLGRRRA